MRVFSDPTCNLGIQRDRAGAKYAPALVEYSTLPVLPHPYVESESGISGIHYSLVGSEQARDSEYANRDCFLLLPHVESWLRSPACGGSRLLRIN